MIGRNRGKRCGLVVALAMLAGCCTSEHAWHIEREELIDVYRESVPSRPLIVIDIDDTVVESGFWSNLRLFFNLYSSKAPFEGAPEALHELRSSWNLVLVSARDDQFAGRTVRWLDAQGFPEAPVVFSNRLLLSASSRAEYKTRVMEHLRQRGLPTAVGIGNEASDVAAYLANEARAILILDGPSDADLDATLAQLRVETLFGGKAAPLELVVLSTEGAWKRITEHLGKNSGRRVAPRLHEEPR